MDSEAELAGILVHEIAHSALSHGYRKIANDSLFAIIQSFPIINNFPVRQLLGADLSREYERQADILATRVIASAGYSADGIYNVMSKLKQLERGSSNLSNWFSTHPLSTERLRYMEELIELNGYNRYAYEGVQSFREAMGQ